MVLLRKLLQSPLVFCGEEECKVFVKLRNCIDSALGFVV